MRGRTRRGGAFIGMGLVGGMLLLAAGGAWSQPQITVVQPEISAYPAAPAAPGAPAGAPGVQAQAAGAAMPGIGVYPYPFLGMNIAAVLKMVERYQAPAQTFNDEYTIIRNGQEIPVFKAHRGIDPDSYEIMGRDGSTSVGNFLAGSDGKVYRYKLGPDLVNVLFKAGNLTAPQFAAKFARMQKIPRWEVKKFYNRTYWQYTDRKGGYQVTIFDDKSLAVEPIRN